MDEEILIKTLCNLLSSGRVESRLILPVLQELSKKSQASLLSSGLISSLQEHHGTAFDSLANHLRTVRRTEAYKCFQIKKSGGSDLSGFQATLGDLPLGIPVSWTGYSTRNRDIEFRSHLPSRSIIHSSLERKGEPYQRNSWRRISEVSCVRSKIYRTIRAYRNT